MTIKEANHRVIIISCAGASFIEISLSKKKTVNLNCINHVNSLCNQKFHGILINKRAKTLQVISIITLLEIINRHMNLCSIFNCLRKSMAQTMLQRHVHTLS